MNDFWAFCAGYGFGSIVIDFIELVYKLL